MPKKLVLMERAEEFDFMLFVENEAVVKSARLVTTANMTTKQDYDLELFDGLWTNLLFQIKKYDAGEENNYYWQHQGRRNYSAYHNGYRSEYDSAESTMTTT